MANAGNVSLTGKAGLDFYGLSPMDREMLFDLLLMPMATTPHQPLPKAQHPGGDTRAFSTTTLASSHWRLPGAVNNASVKSDQFRPPFPL